MADRPTITTFGSGAKYETDDLNDNFEALRDHFDTIYGINGTSGSNNAATGDLDMAGNVIRNALFDGDIVGLDWEGVWAASTLYQVNDLIRDNNANAVYICITEHTSSGTLPISTNTDSAKWELFVDTALAGVTNPMTTRADIIVMNSSLAADRLAVGAAGTVLHGGADPSYSAVVNADITDSTITDAKLSAGAAVPFGCMVNSIFATPPTGWLNVNGDTIGSAASSADQANDDYETLFKSIWDNLASQKALTLPSVGASAQADWDADKKIPLPDLRGRSIIGSGTGAVPAVLTARTHGDSGGEEDHVLTIAELAAHTHTQDSANTQASRESGSNTSSVGDQTKGSGTTGSDSPHNTMHPWYALHWIIKY